MYHDRGKLGPHRFMVHFHFFVTTNERRKMLLPLFALSGLPCFGQVRLRLLYRIRLVRSTPTQSGALHRSQCSTPLSCVPNFCSSTLQISDLLEVCWTRRIHRSDASDCSKIINKFPEEIQPATWSHTFMSGLSRHIKNA